MSVANYFASLTDHTQILVSVKCEANVNTESVQYVLKGFESHQNVIINDAGCSINVKFSTDVPLENNIWGHFQAHRQVCGLIFLAEATSAMESALILDRFNKLKEGYGPGLYQSRCIIFGIDTAIRPSQTNVFQFSSHDAWKSIDYDIKQFIISIYYELESKRHKLLQEKQSKPLLILAPFETPEERTSETDSKLLRRKCLGRHNKHIGDIHLLLGLIPESLQYYNTAFDMLVSAGDLVWVGCALEGLCIVSAMVLFNDNGVGKNLRTKDAPNPYALDPRQLSMKQTSGVNWTDVKKYCIPSFKELVDKYREAIINYSKVKGVAVIELEACIKATKIFSRANKYLEASEFIQNAVYINLSVPEPERLKRYSVMGDLYKDIKFLRKSFFYKRVAAMQCVSPQLKEAADWNQCYELLMEAISNLSYDSKRFPNDLKGSGWPSVIQRVWRELVFALERNGNRPLSNRHLLHIFLSMFPFMSETEEKDIHTSLEGYARNKKDIPEHVEDFQFELDFYRCPVIKAVLPQMDIDGYRPIKSQFNNVQSVFIYTPASFKAKEQNQQKLRFDWCVNTPCRIDVEVYNPLSHCPIQVHEFKFTVDPSEDCLYELPPFSFSVPPQVTSKVTVSITPAKSGLVKIVGYTYKIFGVQANCFFANNNDIRTTEIAIDVIPELPLVKCEFTGTQVDYHENDIPEIVAYAGETLNLPFQLHNTGSSLVSSWDVAFKSKLTDEQAILIYNKNFDEVKLGPGSKISLPVKVEARMAQKSRKCSYLCTLVMKYAAELDEVEWWRTVEIEMNLVFKKSAEVTNVTVENPHGFSNPMCNLKLTITSHFNETAKLSWDEHAELSQKSASVPEKCIYSCDVNFKKMSLPNSLGGNCDLENILLQYVKNTLNVNWEIKTGRWRHHFGVASYNVAIRKQDFSKIINVPVVCSLSQNESLKDAFIPLAETFHFSFNFSNASGFKQSLRVSLEIYQDQLNGFVERNLEDCVLCLGSTHATFDLDPDDCTEFPCDIVILKEGSYCVRVIYTIFLSGSSSAANNAIQCFSPCLTLKSES